MSRRGPILQFASVLGFLLCVSPLVAQQSYTITGRVLADGSGAAVQGAQVSLSGTSGGSTTSSAGMYMLAEILEQRRVELYLQHVRWSDLRRFGLTPKFMWAPIPITECDRNAATPSALCQAQPPNIPHDS